MVLPLLLQLDEGTRVLGVGVGVFLFGLAVVLAVVVCIAGKVAENGCAGLAGGVLILALVIFVIAISPRESTATASVDIDYDDNGLFLNVLLFIMILSLLGTCGCWLQFHGVVQYQGVPLDNYVGS